MSFSPAVKVKVLVACARHCCICHRSVGLKIELHHIVQKSAGGKNSFENCIPLCFDCHGDMRSYDHKHPKGTKYTEDELKKHRDAWYARVSGAPLTVEYSEASAALDRKLSASIAKTLPWHTVKFVRDHHFRAAFRSSNMDPIYQLYDQKDDPSFEFIDAEMEGHRASMMRAAVDLLTLVAQNVSPGHNPRIVGVPKDWEQTAPDTHRQVVKELNKAGEELADAYANLIRTARRKLGLDLSD